MDFFFSLVNVIHNDVPEPWQLGFQDSASPVFTGIEVLHNTIGFYLIYILISVLWVASSVVYYFNKNKVKTFIFFKIISLFYYFNIILYYDMFMLTIIK